MTDLILIDDLKTAKRLMNKGTPVYLTHPDPKYVLGTRYNNPTDQEGKIVEVDGLIFVDWNISDRHANCYKEGELSYKGKKPKPKKKLKLDNLYA